MSLPPLRQILVAHGPSQLSRFLTRHTSKVMVDCIRKLKVQSGKNVTVEKMDMRSIKLENGIELIGHPANKTERKVLGAIAREYGLDPSYAKVLMDAITRYTYPHCGGAVLAMDYPIETRFMFHPQQKNFLLEEASIPKEKREQISQHFEPQEGWHCLDVGGFLGHGATWLRGKVGDSGKIICVEANANNRRVLDEHMKRNGFQNVQSKFAAIWHTAGETITFHLTNRQGNAIDNEVVDGSTKVDVPTVSIPSLTSELGQAADFLSLTVNGAEIEALEGIKKMERKDYPKRIIAPGWYLKEGRKRIEFMEPLLKELGYQYVVTNGLLSFAWLDESVGANS